jgi:hypothetical protein
MRCREIKAELSNGTLETRRSGMLNINRIAMDRRCGDDRRKSYRLGYFVNGGVERRSGQERRVSGERRVDWLRATEWSSVPGLLSTKAPGGAVDYSI